MVSGVFCVFEFHSKTMVHRKLFGYIIFCLAAFALPQVSVQAQDGADAEASAIPGLIGQIAYIGDDFNIYTVTEDGFHQLTDDASELRRYQWPTWSTDGRLAYFVSDIQPDGEVTMETYISQDGADVGDLAYTGSDELFNYAYWSPGNCTQGSNCRNLAVLLSSEAAGGLFVQMVRDSITEPVAEHIGSGGPFYYSWSPDGSRMLWQRNNSSMDIYDAETNAVVDTLSQTPGIFQAPMWSPVDDRLLFATRTDNDTNNLVIVANGEEQVLVSDLEGRIAFAWSPDGNSIAYTNQQGPLYVIDAVTGDVMVRSNIAGVLAFFWSPNSEHIAFITLSSVGGEFAEDTRTTPGLASPVAQRARGLEWSVLDVDDNEIRQYGVFLPTQEMLYMFVYFDQFAQSHRVWSPDSRHLIYSEITPDGDNVINLLDTSRVGTVPFSIAEGSIGIWSYD